MPPIVLLPACLAPAPLEQTDSSTAQGNSVVWTREHKAGAIVKTYRVFLNRTFTGMQYDQVRSSNADVHVSAHDTRSCMHYHALRCVHLWSNRR